LGGDGSRSRLFSNRWLARPTAVWPGRIPYSRASVGTIPPQTSTSHAVISTVASLRVRLPETAAGASAHSTYHGSSQLTQATPISPAQPAAVAHRRVRQANAAHTAPPVSIAIVMTRRMCASAPPRPAA
jgi:hypothetical protein